MTRTIGFAEVQSFYAAVERSADPTLATRPVIVGGDPRKRGRVQAATPDALAQGVIPDMLLLEALQRCPRARAIRTDMRRYREVSRKLMAVLREAVGRVEEFQLGAGYFEVSGGARSADTVARDACSSVREATGLPLRVGIGSGKHLARLAAEQVEVEGSYQVPPGQEQRFLAPLEVGRLDGVGQRTAATLADLGARTIGDVVALGKDRLQEALGTHGLRIYAYASGNDEEPLRAARHPRTLSRERTLPEEPRDVIQITEQLHGLAEELEGELRRQGLAAGRVALKVRYADQATATRSQTLGAPTRSAVEVQAAASRLLARTQAGARAVRGLGIQLGALVQAAEGDRQLDLFSSEG